MTKPRFQTPVGSFDSYEEAAAACERCDLEPVECVTVHRDPPPSKPVREFAESLRSAAVEVGALAA